MNSQDFRNLQEAYLDVYRQEELLDENREMSRDPEGSERRRTRSRQPDPSKPDFTGIGNMSIDQIRKMSARIEKEKTKKESYLNVYEQEEVLDEAQYTPPPQIQQPPAEVRNAPKNKLSPVSTVGTGLAAAYLGNEIGKKLLKKKPNVKGVFEKLDIFGIVLEYLITEGYADTQEAAERIMVNMSEEWRESIVEEVLDEAYVDYKKGKLPSGRTPQQAAQGRSELLNARERNRPLGKLDGTYSRQQNQGRRTKEMDKLTASNPVNRAMRRGLGSMLPGGQPSTDRHSNAMDRRNRVADIASAEKKSRDR